MEKIIRCLLFSFFTCLPLCDLLAQSSDAQMSVYEVIRSHRRASGDVDLARKLNSIHSTGTLEQGGEVAKIELFKNNGCIRYEIILPHEVTIITYDGKDAWKWKTKPASNEVTQLNSARTEWIAKEAIFDNLLDNYSELDYRVKLLDTTEVEGMAFPVYHIRMTHRYSAEQIDIFLDKSTFLERRREYRPNEKEMPLVTDFSDFRTVGGMVVPYLIENYMGETLISVTQLDKVELNVGVLSFYFDPPKGRMVIVQE